jgi:N-acetylornithine carbamoyltransferase
MASTAALRHLVRLSSLDQSEIDSILDASVRFRREDGGIPLSSKTIGLLFFRASLRTRASFEAAVGQLGGHPIDLNSSSDLWDLEVREGGIMDGAAPEHVRDAATVLSRYVDLIAIRTAPQGSSWKTDRQDAEIHSWAKHAEVPVINMESALWHPLQTLADLMTMREHFGDLPSRKLTIVWTHSPTAASPSVVNSLLHATIRSGMQVRLAHPPGYELDPEVLEEAQHLASISAGSYEITHDLADAVDGAEVVYGRSWWSLDDYGNPTLAASRRARHTDWKVDASLLARGDHAHFMHPMPVRRNLEVSDSILDGPESLVYQQAENRLHSQKALLCHLLSSSPEHSST